MIESLNSKSLALQTHAGGQDASVPRPSEFIAMKPWSNERPQTLVVCCSDGRWHAQLEEFLRRAVSDRADLYAVPGGPVALSLWSSSFDEANVAEKSFRFLVEHHDLRSVWLIAHADCAYYRHKYHPHDAEFLLRRQFDDLKRSRETILRWYPQLDVQQVFARLNQGRVVFSILKPDPW